ncbi:MAG: SDR family oxidoreductase [Alkalibacterium sp.]|uniref:NAD(P)H-binding n=1 Tax=Alkalibacterium gilvum TaxID=1130080 RepID=A0A1H6VIG3_9LACT|nr:MULTISPECIES: SDR family oxidoreductase [Alkalibacterium]MDN6195271.1 SDR family oxidoreductase [Atopostipes suicloacalis]MDN6294073.1 SDR family oxidoreductase [Alkalibacterium sp.]MDN6295681.1 SDR family oxidoreductase [Alkalibacterium sp.]MDN6326986.1 SDR family oxidoreductase [Alkalibacterium sp.]MDN6385530.1 SDR family oxidoreductase [Alkalibacterium sp.]
MNVLVVGANGQIGQHLIDELKKQGKHNPIAFVRKEEQVEHFKKQDVKARLGDLESSIDEIKKSMTDIDAVVFTAGSGGSTGSDKTLLVDLDGAVKVIEATKASGIDRFVMVSALGADERDRWSEELKGYYVAKHFADMWLLDSNLNYTIVRPGMLLNEESIGKVLVKEAIKDNDVFSIPRIDVAKTIVATLDNENTYHKSFDLVTGQDTLDEALKSL